MNLDEREAAAVRWYSTTMDSTEILSFSRDLCMTL